MASVILSTIKGGKGLLSGERGSGIWSEEEEGWSGREGRWGVLSSFTIFQRELPFFTIFHFRENGRPPPKIGEYGQCAVGTHPTGMHTCYFCYLSDTNQ